ncbi:unnamed protein product [Pieris macdunnoughi]|uniref:Cysteine proteinase n=1 Tax=Pieris macdunnoughi TaxID=345717 RepID=A0A821TAQ3_9NEOP|nr:unnamed protein product [Pieris macdunnoughi]
MYSILLLLLVSTSKIFCEKFHLLHQNYYDIDESEEIFKQFLEYFDKFYDKSEYRKRLNVLKDNLLKINQWNKEENRKYTLNEFADLTEDEFSQTYLGLNEIISSRTGVDVIEYESKGGAPENLDWRRFGYVSSVKHQSQFHRCGSCYAFSAVGHIESRHAMKHNITAINLSAQQALDCDYLDLGCDGGDPVHVFETLSEQGGSMRDKDYPYVSVQGKCKTDKEEIEVKVNGGTQLMLKDEDAMKDAVAHLGPLSVAIRFTHKMAAKVTHEIYDGAYCETSRTNNLNHAVIVVGYGRENNKDYWIIKNSWGEKWGDHGYLRLIRGVGACGIGNVAFLADVE